MTLLASAGIYLVLDVNSPLQGHHLNRYEPWTTYNSEYLQNVYAVVDQFSGYNNTLGFFAGNEVVNDKLSATTSPVFVKAVVRDLKNYIEHNAPRTIPVGYSAADDLKYRVSLAEYLECVDTDLAEAVDFYGVNSYQWCGDQTLHSSGYDQLVKAYSDYARPVFFSEYGCNEVTPRAFSEVHALYSAEMTNVFSGGLIYEFSQEPNNYGLVEILPDNSVRLRDDYHALKAQFHALPGLDYGQLLKGMKQNIKNIQRKLKTRPHALPQCADLYENLDISQGLPASVSEQYISTGVRLKRGEYAILEESDLATHHKVFNVDGLPYMESPTVQIVEDTTSEWSSPERTQRGFQNCTYYDLASENVDTDLWSDLEGENSKNGVHGFFQKVFQAFADIKRAWS